MFNHVRNVVDVVIHTFSYVDAYYRPSAWQAYMFTSMPAGNDALVTMLPRLRVDIRQNNFQLLLLLVDCILAALLQLAHSFFSTQH